MLQRHWNTLIYKQKKKSTPQEINPSTDSPPHLWSPATGCLKKKKIKTFLTPETNQKNHEVYVWKNITRMTL